MPTVLEVLQKSADFLGRKGLERPRLEAEWLLARALGCGRLDLYLRFDQPLEEAQLEPLREQVARRGRREPGQYIAGRAGFLDFEVGCDRRALIPRPETEELAELVFARVTEAPTAALDLGTGTGVLAIALARRWPECRVTALEASAAALELARANAAALGAGGRIRFLNTRWPEGFKELGPAGRFQVVVANPPYLTEAEWAAAQPEVREWEPRAALVSGEEGLADLRAILRAAPECLAPGGLLAMETGTGHHAALAAEAAALTDAGGRAAYGRTESMRDMSGRDRFFLAWRA
jgi:release factor glutamine methyltransferase